MIDKLKGYWKTAERWVHRQNPIVSSISHFVICTVGITLLGTPVGALLLWLVNKLTATIAVGAVALVFATAYGAREQRNTKEKGFRQGARDGDTLFGPDFLLAVAGCVAGFTIVKAILGIM